MACPHRKSSYRPNVRASASSETGGKIHIRANNTHSKYELVCSYGAQMSVKCRKMAVQDKWDKIQKTYVLSTSQVQVTNPTRSNFPPRHRSRIRRASLRNSLTSSFIILSFSGLHALVRGLAAKHRELSSLEIFFSVLSLLTFMQQEQNSYYMLYIIELRDALGKDHQHSSYEAYPPSIAVIRFKNVPKYPFSMWRKTGELTELHRDATSLVIPFSRQIEHFLRQAWHSSKPAWCIWNQNGYPSNHNKFLAQCLYRQS